MPAPDRERLIEELGHQARASTLWTVLLHNAIASRSGINVTDMQCINLLQLRGPMTPGQLADAMFLTTGGAITAVIDRLEKAGMVRRRRDEDDRRRVIVEAAEGGATAALSARFAPVAEQYGKLLESYSDEHLAVILDYLKRTNEGSPEMIEQVRQLD
ncbi:MarR family transcriptional regulator [Actinoallomurus sp. CA-142502]|uniref:MarR family transcriptional regulator n=1 Tax=Actinoallomurus sp. CA-142502 TaxID=3239885 RepID=UPI003D94547E